MNTALTITRNFHTTRRRDGRQQLRPGPAPDILKGKIPRISRLMALAIHCNELLRTGQVTNQSALAEYAQITPARLTQILTLLNLAPDIQEQILFLQRTTTGRGEVQEMDVRKIAMELDWRRQRGKWLNDFGDGKSTAEDCRIAISSWATSCMEKLSSSTGVSPAGGREIQNKVQGSP